ncbi:ThiF family adenylyltransferase [Zoogloea oleivorans]|uniref:ThiF family adenylyltransferase n=2 Tax=Zoogloea oleivorans TaxID=1552750 RepID=A0A6C2D5Q5_9RHOO|nr:ThiF family adenylyltransferase [Zoogloea oleivorans]
MKPDGVIDFLRNFNGKNSLDYICQLLPKTPPDQIEKIALFLRDNFVLIEHDLDYTTEYISYYYRLLNLLEDFFHRTSDVIGALEKISKSQVAIIGLGAVGSHISLYLARAGVKKFILVDPDKVDVSNIHRQAYSESNIGELKTTCLERKIKEISPHAIIKKIEYPLNKDFFLSQEFPTDVDLIINCADEPSVDYTSSIVSEYAMSHTIPHIVGGGYNLHLTLIGQTIIPYETACYKCFDSKLTEINAIEFLGIRRLDRENRKLGSFSPLSGIAASLASLDAIKVIVGANNFLLQTNKRIEFNSKTKTFNAIDVPRNPACPWCATNRHLKK